VVHHEFDGELDVQRLTIALILALLASPVLAGRDGCTAALVSAGVCRDNAKILWSLDMSSAADAKLQSALARKAGWTAQVTCTQAMVDLSQCTVGQIGTPVANPQSERNAAKAEWRRMIRDEFIRSLDAETLRTDSKEALDAALAAIGNPDVGN